MIILKENLYLVPFLFKFRFYLKSMLPPPGSYSDLFQERDDSKSFFLERKICYHLLKLISSRFCDNSKIYFTELELVGLGYRVSVKKGRIRLGLGFSHVIYLLVPKNVFIIKRKYRILIYGLDRFNLGSFVASLLRFKKLNPYKLKGLKKRHLVYKLKPGKRSK
jgi:ribosomal protein L6P/L9E